MIMARTDARTVLGMMKQSTRKAFAEAGADIVFIESPRAKKR